MIRLFLPVIDDPAQPRFVRARTHDVVLRVAGREVCALERASHNFIFHERNLLNLDSVRLDVHEVLGQCVDIRIEPEDC